MNAFYESFLRKDIFPCQPHYADKVIEVYDADETERHYITNVLENYISGNLSVYRTYMCLTRNIIGKYSRIAEHWEYLDEELKEKLK